MPKYIEKNKLPQFKYYNFCEGVYDCWGEEPKAYAAYHFDDNMGSMQYMGDIETLEDLDIASKDFKTMLKILEHQEDINWLDIRNKWIDSVNSKKGKPSSLIQYMYVVLYAMHKDRYIAEKWKERFNKQIKSALTGKENMNELMLALSMIDEYLTFAFTLRACQGFPLLYEDGDVTYPKMLLLEAQFYKKQRDSKVILEYNLIKNALRDACYIITINGECAERKMCFCLADAGDCAVLSMLDPNNGQTRFFIKPFDEESLEVKEYNASHEEKLQGDTVITADAWRCHPRGDYWCDGKENICVYCNGNHNCKYKSLNIAAAVLYCFQEYIRKLNEARTAPVSKNTNTKTNGKEIKTLIPSDMIRMYDVKYSDEELKRINKFAMFGKGRSEYPSTEKAPHVRKGCMRYNPKTGQKDIAVKGSIIHKDKYQGFASTDRLCE